MHDFWQAMPTRGLYGGVAGILVGSAVVSILLLLDAVTIGKATMVGAWCGIVGVWVGLWRARVAVLRQDAGDAPRVCAAGDRGVE